MTCMGDRRGANRVLVVGPEGKTPLGRPRHRWWNWGEAWSGLIWLRIGTGGRLM